MLSCFDSLQFILSIMNFQYHVLLQLKKWCVCEYNIWFVVLVVLIYLNGLENIFLESGNSWFNEVTLENSKMGLEILYLEYRDFHFKLRHRRIEWFWFFPVIKADINFHPITFTIFFFLFTIAHLPTTPSKIPISSTHISYKMHFYSATNS